MKRLLLALALLLALGVVLWAGVSRMAERLGQARMDDLAAQIAPHARLTWETLSVDLLDRALVLHHVRLASQDLPDLGLTAHTAVLRKSEENRWQAELSGLQPEGPAAARLAEALHAAPEELRGALSADVSWNPGAAALTVHDLHLLLPELFSFRLSGTAANLPSLAGSAQTLAVQSVFIQIGALSARYSDASLAERLIRAEAERLGVTPSAWRAALGDIIENDLRAYAGRAATAEDKAFLAATARALRAFLAEPGTLALELAPRQPMPVVEIVLFPPLEAARRLGLRLEAR